MRKAESEGVMRMLTFQDYCAVKQPDILYIMGQSVVCAFSLKKMVGEVIMPVSLIYNSCEYALGPRCII